MNVKFLLPSFQNLYKKQIRYLKKNSKLAAVVNFFVKIDKKCAVVTKTAELL